jgi:hypothetical protein
MFEQRRLDGGELKVKVLGTSPMPEDQRDTHIDKLVQRCFAESTTPSFHR